MQMEQQEFCFTKEKGLAGYPTRLFMHSLLESQGGAARVCHLLASGYERRGIRVSQTWELADSSQGRSSVVPPHAVSMRIESPGVVHVHSTLSWEALLECLSQARIRPVITLHDARLMTGGCVFPMGCAKWKGGCLDPCARGYGDAASKTARIRSLVRELRPVLVAPSRWMAFMAREVFPDVRTYIVPNGVPWDVPPSGTCDLPSPSHAQTLLFVAHGGEGSAMKGGSSWRSIWTRVKKEVPHCKGIFVGGDASAMEKDITVLPYVPADVLGTIMAKSTLLVYPTLADNHPLVILEAMAQRLPSVAYDVGGIREQIVDGENGILVPENDEYEMARAVVGLLRRPISCRTLGEAAWQMGRKRFSLDRMVEGYLGVYAREGLMEGA